MFNVTDKVEGFKKKLLIWKSRMEEKVFDMFPLFDRIAQSSSTDKIDEMSKIVTDHLSALAGKFNEYFPTDPRKGNLWILNPFESDVEKDCTNLPIDLANELADLSSDSGLKLKWSQMSVPEFWIYCPQ